MLYIHIYIYINLSFGIHDSIYVTLNFICHCLLYFCLVNFLNDYRLHSCFTAKRFLQNRPVLSLLLLRFLLRGFMSMCVGMSCRMVGVNMSKKLSSEGERYVL